MKYKVWNCKIVVPDDELPEGFDFPPRSAAINAIASARVKILCCFSGWGGELNAEEKLFLDNMINNQTPKEGGEVE